MARCLRSARACVLRACTPDFNPSTCSAALWLKHTYDALELAAARGEPHLYVHMMAVAPELQGRGVGSQLLTTVLSRATRQHPGTRVVLTTHLPANVDFYRRAGFEVSDEKVLCPPGGVPYTVWSMIRDS